jgi:hypothetical protein
VFGAPLLRMSGFLVNGEIWNWRGHSLVKRGKTRQRDRGHKKDPESVEEAGKMIETVTQA